jgi:hypothetical protein
VVNAGAGRDHWAAAFSVLLAGAGIPGGRVCGATDRRGAFTADRAIHAGQLAATVLHALGVEPTTQVPTLLGRPWQIADEEPVLDLWA